MWSLSLMFYRDKCVSFLLSKSVFRAPVTEYLLFPVKFQWILLFYSIFIHFAKWEGWLIPRRGSVTTPLKWLSAGLLSTQTKPDALAHPVHTFISAHKNREQTGLEDWGVREYQTPLCCGCHSLCLSESLFVLTLTRTKSLSTTTLACIVLIQIITRQLIYIFFFFLILFSKAKQPSSQQVVQLTQQKGTVSHLLCSCSPVKQINWPWKWPVWCKQLLSLCSQKQKVSHFVFTSEFGFRFNAVYLQCIYLHLNYLSYVSLKCKHYGSVQTCKKIFLSFI